MKKILYLILGIVFLLGFLIFFVSYKYDLVEKEAQKLIPTNSCAITSISLVLIEYYDIYNKYPKPNEFEETILNSHHFSDLNCKMIYREMIPYIIDKDGKKLIYNYQSSGLVDFYFEEVNRKKRIIYELSDNKLVRK